MAEPKPPAPKPAPPPAVMAAVAWEDEWTEAIKTAFPVLELEFLSYLGQNFIVAPPGAIVDLLRRFHDVDGFTMLVDLTAVDYPKKEQRFELIYILYSFEHNRRIRIKTRVAENQTVPSATPVYLGADWLEREVFDMFGIQFAGHPNLKRILMPDEWQGFPLRKDYSILAMDHDWVQAHLGIESGQ